MLPVHAMQIRMNARHKVVLALCLAIAGFALMTGAKISEALGILLIGASIAWLIGSIFVLTIAKSVWNHRYIGLGIACLLIGVAFATWQWREHQKRNEPVELETEGTTLKWYKMQASDGKWYKTRAASPEEAKAKITRWLGRQQASASPYDVFDCAASYEQLKICKSNYVPGLHKELLGGFVVAQEAPDAIVKVTNTPTADQCINSDAIVNYCNEHHLMDENR